MRPTYKVGNGQLMAGVPCGDNERHSQMGTQCTASFKPDLKGVETQGIVVVCWSRFANPWLPHDEIRANPPLENRDAVENRWSTIGGATVPLDFNFVMMGAREPETN